MTDRRKRAQRPEIYADASAPLPSRAVKTADQGEAVDAAIEGARSTDVDRWAGFSQDDADELAQQPAKPDNAQIALAGLPHPK